MDSVSYFSLGFWSSSGRKVPFPWTSHCAQLIDFLALPSASALFHIANDAQSLFVFRFIPSNFSLRPVSDRTGTGYLRGVCGSFLTCHAALTEVDPGLVGDPRFNAQKKRRPVHRYGSCRCFQPIAHCEPHSRQLCLSAQRSFVSSYAGLLRFGSKA